LTLNAPDRKLKPSACIPSRTIEKQEQPVASGGRCIEMPVSIPLAHQ